MAVRTLLQSNPFTDSFSGSALAAPWATAGLGGAPTINFGALRAIALNGVDRQWDSTGSPVNAHRAMLTLFPQFVPGPTAVSNEYAQADFFVRFKVTGLQASGAGNVGKAAGGFALFRSDDQTKVVPIIEFGTNDGVSPLRIFHSWTNFGQIGSVADEGNALTLPFYVRITRADDAVWAELSQDGLTNWFNIKTTAVAARYQRAVPQSPLDPLSDYNGIAIYARNDNVNGRGFVLDIDDFSVTMWPRFSNQPPLKNLRARTWPSGLRNDLSWTLPTGEDEVRSMTIFRHRLGHQEFWPRSEQVPLNVQGYVPGAIGEKLYEGPVLAEYIDTGVIADRFYYYSVFASRVPYGMLLTGEANVLRQEIRPNDSDWSSLHPSNKVTGLVIHDYINQDNLERFYQLFPAIYRELDEQDRIDIGAVEGMLRKYSRFLQRGVDLVRGYVSGLIKSNHPELATLGMVGTPGNAHALVDARLRDFGLPPLSPSMEGIAKRRLWRYALEVLRKKGTIPGLVQFTELVTGWKPVTATEPGLGLDNNYLFTWDGFSSREEYTSSALVWTAGQVTGFVGLVPGKYDGGLLMDYHGRTKKILSNTATTILFEDVAFVGANELVLTATVGGTGDDLTGFGWPAGFGEFVGGPNDDAYETHDGAPKIAGDKGGVFVITDILTANMPPLGEFDPTSRIVVPTTSFNNGAGQTFAIAHSFAGATFGTRVPTTQVWLFPSPDISTLYDPRRRTTVDKKWLVWPGPNYGPGTVPFDVVVNVPPGAARYPTLIVNGLTENYVQVAGGPNYPDVRPGDFINPNRDQAEWYHIIDITTSGGDRRYWVRRKAVTPVQVAESGDIAVIAYRATVERDQLLRSMASLILPWDSRLYIYYT